MTRKNMLPSEGQMDDWMDSLDPEERATVEAREERIRRIIQELVFSALTAIPEPGPRAVRRRVPTGSTEQARNPMTNQNERLERLERIEIIRDAARTAYENIDKCGYAITSFEPGDGTRYVVIIGVDPDGYDWWVSLGGYGGRTYRWHPDNSTFTDKEYCGHWTSNQQARGVLSTFLNALRDAYNLAPAHDPDPAPTDDHKEPPRTMRIEITPFDSIETVTVTPGVGHTVIRDCFNGVTLETDDGERLSIVMRDSGFEALYSVDNDPDNDEALSLSLQNGKIQFDTGARS